MPPIGGAAMLVALGLGVPNRRPVPVIALITLLVSLGMTTMTAFNPSASIAGSVGLILTMLIVLLAWRRMGVEDRWPLAVGLALGSIGSALHSAYQLLVLGLGRAHGGFWHANVLGAVATLSTLALGIAAAREHDPLRRLLLVCGAFASAATVVMSMSRGALLATAVGALLFTFQGLGAFGNGGQSFRARWFAIAAGSAAIVLLSIGGALVALRFSDANASITDSGRDLIWRVTLELAGDRPFLGHGFGAWRDIVAAYEPAINTFSTSHAHSLYLQLLFDVGTLGVAAILGIAIVSFVLLLRRRPDLRTPLLVTFAAAASSNLTEPVAYLWQYNLVLLISMLAACNPPEQTLVVS